MLDLTATARRTNTYVRTNLSHLLPTAPIANVDARRQYENVWRMTTYSRGPAFSAITVTRIETADTLAVIHADMTTPYIFTGPVGAPAKVVTDEPMTGAELDAYIESLVWCRSHTQYFNNQPSVAPVSCGVHNCSFDTHEGYHATDGGYFRN